MNNHERYMAALKKLAGTGKRTCQHSGCRTMTLATYCRKHKEAEVMTEKTFITIDLSDDSAPGICSYCSQHGTEHAPSGTAFVYCFHRECGAFRRPGATWARVENISAGDFKTAMLTGVLKFENVILSTDGMTPQ